MEENISGICLDGQRLKELAEKLRHSPALRGDIPQGPGTSGAYESRISPEARKHSRVVRLDYTEKAPQTGEGTGLRSSNPYVTLVCGKETNGTVTWITEPPFYSGFSGNDQYFMYGIVDIDALCDGYHIPRSCLTGLTVTLYGSSDSTYIVWTNEAVSYVGQSTSVSLTYPVNMLQIMGMGYSDFVISHAASAGLIGFMNGCSIQLSYQTTDISYASDSSLQTFDIHFPINYTSTSGQRPAVVLIHGGNWTGGDKSDMAGLVSHITSLNRICVNMNYRLVTYWSTEVTCATMMSDIKDLIWKLKNSYSDCINATKIALMGYSAGGYLAYQYAIDYTQNTGTPSPIPVKLVISVAGPTDLKAVWNNPPAGIPLCDLEGLLFSLSGGHQSYEPDFENALEVISPFHSGVSIPTALYTSMFYSSDDDFAQKEVHKAPLYDAWNTARRTCYDFASGSGIDHSNILSTCISNTSVRSIWQGAITGAC